MALTYNGTNVSSVPDVPSGFSQSITAVSSPDYTKTYSITVAKASVDTTGTPVTNFTALIAAVDAAVEAALADFNAALTVTASGSVSSFNLNGGTKYINTTNTSSYTCDVITSITVV